MKNMVFFPLYSMCGMFTGTGRRELSNWRQNTVFPNPRQTAKGGRQDCRDRFLFLLSSREDHFPDSVVRKIGQRASRRDLIVYRRENVSSPRENGVLFPLSFQAALLTVIVFSITTTLLVWRLSARVSDQLYSQIKLRGEAIVAQMAAACTRPMMAGDLLFVESIAREAGHERSIREASIVTFVKLKMPKWPYGDRIPEQGLVIAHSDPSKVGKPYELPEGLSLNNPSTDALELTDGNGGRFLLFRRPMVYRYKGAERIIGSAEIRMDITGIDQALKQVRSDITLYGVLSAALGVVGMILLFNIILRPVRQLTTAMSRLQEGDFTLHVISHDKSEVGLLTRTFNNMAAELNSLQRKLVQQELIRKELEIAKTIQLRLLPEDLPRIPGLEIAARCVPAEEVGGDYYDVFPVSDSTWALVVGDVSGKGVPGSLVMTMTRSVLRSVATVGQSPGNVLIRTNRVICRDIPSGMFVSLVLIYFDTSTGKLTFTSAGHPPPILVREKRLLHLKVPGIPLGADDSGVFEKVMEEGVLQLHRDDLLLVYT
ncbi:MAG TPA: HAMP domain-containing protein, partial [Bacteroidetes bacterium]|nr:HAMP domain-containing protein [Bacteroidota bacterium]